jgi:HSP20 family protein
MSPITRWDPFQSVTPLRDAMSQLFEQAVLRPGYASLGGGIVGQMNVLEADGHYLVAALLPGVKPEDIDVTVRQNVLTIKGAKPQLLPEEQLKNATWLLREFGPGEFVRSITFAKDVAGEKVDAHFDRGVLTLVVPFAEHAQPKRITIQAEGRQPEHLLVDEKASANSRAPASVG